MKDRDEPYIAAGFKDSSSAKTERALKAVARWSRDYGIATILGTERLTEAGRQIAAYVFDANGELQGFQTKNQLDPSEDEFYVPGNTRRLFEAGGVKFGVSGKRIKVHKQLVSATARTGGTYERERFDCVR